MHRQDSHGQSQLLSEEGCTREVHIQSVRTVVTTEKLEGELGIRLTHLEWVGDHCLDQGDGVNVYRCSKQHFTDMINNIANLPAVLGAAGEQRQNLR